MDYDRVFIHEFFLKIPEDFLTSVNVRILVDLFFKFPLDISKSAFDLSIINVYRMNF